MGDPVAGQAEGVGQVRVFQVHVMGIEQQTQRQVVLLEKSDGFSRGVQQVREVVGHRFQAGADPRITGGLRQWPEFGGEQFQLLGFECVTARLTADQPDEDHRVEVGGKLDVAQHRIERCTSFRRVGRGHAVAVPAVFQAGADGSHLQPQRLGPG